MRLLTLVTTYHNVTDRFQQGISNGPKTPDNLQYMWIVTRSHC